MEKKSCVSIYASDRQYSYFGNSDWMCDATDDTVAYVNVSHPQAHYGCSALYITDLHTQHLLSLPCDQLSVKPDRKFPLVCEYKRQDEKEANNLTEISNTTDEIGVCESGWVYIDGGCYRFTHSPPGVVSNFFEICGGSLALKINEDGLLLDYIIHWGSVYIVTAIIDEPEFPWCIEVSVITMTTRDRPYIKGTRRVDCMAPSNSNESIKLLCYADPNPILKDNCGPGMFQCHDDSCIQDVLVCDGTSNCPHSEDEIVDCPPRNTSYTAANDADFFQMFTEKCVPPYITCPSEECVHTGQVCDGHRDCSDGSDEMACYQPVNGTDNDKGHNTNYQVEPGILRLPERVGYCHDRGQAACRPDHTRCYPYHRLCMFDRSQAALLYCPDGGHLLNDICFYHQCPEAFKCPSTYCVPHHRVCDGFPDCPGQEDEAQCGVGKFHPCPGLLRCQGEERCVHPYYYNDGISQCKYADDEAVTFVCPVGCQCFSKGIFCQAASSHEILKVNPSPSVVSLKYTSLTLTNVFYPVFERTSRLVLSGGSLYRLPQPPFLTHLVILDLSNNSLNMLHRDFFLSLHNLLLLILADNHLTKLLSVCHACNLAYLNVRNNTLNYFEHGLCSCKISHMKLLDIAYNPIVPVHFLTSEISDHIHVVTDSHGICCTLTVTSNCYLPGMVESVETCTYLLGNTFIRVLVFSITIVGTLSNLYVCYWRVRYKIGSPITRLQVVFLSAANLLIEVYAIILIVQDLNSAKFFPFYEKIWKNSICCHLGGFLLYFGYQSTVVVKFIIALDRKILLRHAVRRIGLSKTQNVAFLVCSAIVTCSITLVPFILKFSEIYPKMNTDAGSMVCIPFLFIYRDTLPTAYQSTVFLFVNFVIFTAIAVCYGVSMHKGVKSGSDLDHGMGAIIDQGRRRRTNKMLATTIIGLVLSMAGWLLICLMEIIITSSDTVREGSTSRGTYQYIVFIRLLSNPIADPIIFYHIQQ